MADMEQIRYFAIKWLDKFKNPNTNYIELADHYLGDDCGALGFDMDCGQAFARIYGGAVSSYTALEHIIDDVTDISLLGSAIYSRWRYFNHWAYNGAEIANTENRSWFIIALTRLEELSSENIFNFDGIPKMMRIISNNICYICPEPDEEIEQHITINTDGQVLFSGYALGDKWGKRKELRGKNFSIDKAVAAEILNKVSYVFRNEYFGAAVKDIGIWKLELTNTDEKTYVFFGSLCDDFEVDGVDLSNLIRDSLDMQDLYVFDGNNKPDVINRIILNYNRVKKIKPKEIPEGAEQESVTWSYADQLIIDRDAKAIELIQNINDEHEVSHKYKVGDNIGKFLDRFDADEFFENIEGNPDDVVETPNESKTYKITIDYKKNPQKIITGTFDKNGLPDDFEEFANEVFDLFAFYGFGEILNFNIYGKARRRASEYIFCSVIFDVGQKSYYYLTEDDSINVDDLVIVPAGKDNHEAIAKVVAIDYYTKDNAPFPVKKTKHIIRKCTNDDFELY